MFWCFILHVTTSKNVLKCFTLKTFAKMHVEHMLKTGGGYM